jgi:AcrR family transcriptional regulator
MNAFAPRKKPVQGRSKATVEAILEATIRVLLDADFESLTTTKVAEVAGVGVGTLYQYFPGKESLLLALLEQDMRLFESALVDAVSKVSDASLPVQIEAAIDTILRHKGQRAELGAALHAEMPRVDGARIVRATMKRIIGVLAKMIAPHMRGVAGVDPERMAVTITTSVQGAVEGALALSPRILRRPEFREELVRLVLGYLRESGWRGSGAGAEVSLPPHELSVRRSEIS